MNKTYQRRQPQSRVLPWRLMIRAMYALSALLFFYSLTSNDYRLLEYTVAGGVIFALTGITHLALAQLGKL